jgi:hypothetical protein
VLTSAPLQHSNPAIMSLSNKLSISDVDLKGKRVLIRVSSFSRSLAACHQALIDAPLG